jgi:hypothetical protein
VVRALLEDQRGPVAGVEDVLVEIDLVDLLPDTVRLGGGVLI